MLDKPRSPARDPTVPDTESRQIRIHSNDDYDGMRKAGKLAAETLDFIAPHVVPGALGWYDLPDLARQLGARLRTR